MTTHDMQPTEAQPTGAHRENISATPDFEAPAQTRGETFETPAETAQTPAETFDASAERLEAPAERVEAPAQSGETADTSDAMLFADGELSDMRTRWTEVQSAFVDDPRDCVQKADGLVADVVDKLTTSFSGARAHLEEQWSRGEQVSTEDLRIALKRYREFFERLLAV
jgi:hypothetical protein